MLSCPAHDGKPGFAVTVEQQWPDNDGLCEKSRITVTGRESWLEEVQYSKKIECGDGDALLNRLKAAYPNSFTSPGNPDREWYIYLLKQCRTFAWKWYPVDWITPSECPG